LSRDLKDSEKEGHNFKEYIIGRDGIALVVHPSNTVTELTLSQVKDIYQGTITNWKEVGGSDSEIVLVGRDSASGTREFFTEFVLNDEDAAKTMQELNSNGAVQQSVAQTPGAIGYVSLEYVDDTVKALTIDGVTPSVATVLDGTYTINRPLLMITDGEATGLAKSYLDFILSAEGQQILSDNGFVPVSGGSTTVTPTSAVTSGTISVAGSTTVLPVAQAVAEVYMDEHLSADIQISGGGSGVGVTSVSSGTADIGMLSRDLKDSEKEGHDFKEYVIGRDGIALIVHPTNTVTELTLSQVKDIYQGTITNWKEVGGSDSEIVLVGRDSASGTREFFTEFVLNDEDAAKTMQELNSNGAVQQSVAQTPGAIGYVSLEYVDDTVKALTIDGVTPSVATVLDGTYTINRPLLMITDGEPTGLAKSYLDFILSAEGQQILSDNGFVPVA
ncbi:MAG TPA: phosphate ABC transporter substrate-binding protein, partial [Methanocorpusculum sp.]|nr:phosphate ABC transporter substrate-binding protein [Methanocorpusculum sp.]